MLITDFWQAFQKGKQLTNSAVWKERTVAGSLVVGFLSATLAIAKAFGYDIQIDSATLEAIGFGVAAIVAGVNAVVHTVTTTKIGLPDKTVSGDQDAGVTPRDY